jgi:site-specific recombinase XerD
MANSNLAGACAGSSAGLAPLKFGDLIPKILLPLYQFAERGGPMSPIGFHRLIQRVGEAAKMPFPIHPHMLRHACGFKLANDGHDTRALQHYLGHKNIQHTVGYTEMAPNRFKNFWR